MYNNNNSEHTTLSNVYGNNGVLSSIPSNTTEDSSMDAKDIPSFIPKRLVKDYIELRSKFLFGNLVAYNYQDNTKEVHF